MPQHTERVFCNQCRGKTSHHVVGDVEESIRDDETEFSWSIRFEMLQCGGCQEVVLRRTYTFSEDPDVSVQFFPPEMSRVRPEWRYSLPKDLRSLLDEIYRSLDSENLRLPMMGARTLIDMLITEKIGDVGNFKQKLVELERKGFLSSGNSETLYAALEVGNAAAHRGHAATLTEVNAVMDVVENLLQAVYVFPGITRRLREGTPSRPVAKRSLLQS